VVRDVSKEHTAFIFRDQAVKEEEQDSMFVPNVRQHTLKDAVSHPRRTKSSVTPLGEH
jgi:hypothetical protein